MSAADHLSPEQFYHGTHSKAIDNAQTGYLHLGSKAAAESRQAGHGAGDGTYQIHKVTVQPQHPFNSPSTPLDDWTANLIGHYDANRHESGRLRKPMELDETFEDAPSVAKELGWTPKHDAIYYDNAVEDPGHVSVMARPSAIRP